MSLAGIFVLQLLKRISDQTYLINLDHHSNYIIILLNVTRSHNAAVQVKFATLSPYLSLALSVWLSHFSLFLLSLLIS